MYIFLCSLFSPSEGWEMKRRREGGEEGYVWFLSFNENDCRVCIASMCAGVID